MLTKAAIIQIILSECKAQQINSDLMRAIITVESNFNPNAIRFERSFTYYWKDEEFSKIQQITLDTEKQCQKFSVGLGQLMFGTARWLGFSGTFLDLFDAPTNIHWVAQYFKKVCSKYVYTNDKIAAYNAGSVRKDPQTNKYFNQDYVDRVVSELDKIQNSSAKAYYPSSN